MNKAFSGHSDNSSQTHIDLARGGNSEFLLVPNFQKMKFTIFSIFMRKSYLRHVKAGHICLKMLI